MPRTATRIAFGLLILTTVLALLAGLAGRMLPRGESLLLSLPGKSLQSAVYLFDVERRLPYPINESGVDTYVMNPADNDWAAYANNPGGNWDVYRTNLFTRETHRLTDGPGYDGQVAWSTDGQWLAFLSDRGGGTNIYGVSVNGGVPKRLTRGLGLKEDPAWSPDGERMVFNARDSNGSVHLFVADVHCLIENPDCPQRVMQLTSSTRGDYFPTWSPDGRWIAFLSDRGGRTDVYIVDTACLNTSAGCIQQNARQLTHGVRATRALSWSRDGQYLRFIAEFTNRPVLYTIPMACDLLPEGCVLETLLAMQ